MHRKVVVAIGLGLFFEIYEIFLSSTISTTLKTQYDLDGTTLKLLLASTFVGHVHRIGRTRPARRPDRQASGLSVQPRLVLGMVADRGLLAHPVVSRRHQVPGRHRRRRRVSGSRCLPLRRAAQVGPRTTGGMGLHVVVRRRAGARVRLARAHQARPLRHPGLATAPGDRRSRSRAGHPDAPGPAGITALAGERRAGRRSQGRAGAVRDLWPTRPQG